MSMTTPGNFCLNAMRPIPFSGSETEAVARGGTYPSPSLFYETKVSCPSCKNEKTGLKSLFFLIIIMNKYINKIDKV